MVIGFPQLLTHGLPLNDCTHSSDESNVSAGADTVIGKLAVPTFPAASDAVHVTVVVPTEKLYKYYADEDLRVEDSAGRGFN